MKCVTFQNTEINRQQIESDYKVLVASLNSALIAVKKKLEMQKGREEQERVRRIQMEMEREKQKKEDEERKRKEDEEIRRK